MAPDEARKEDVRAWLRNAALDLRAGEHALSDPQAKKDGHYVEAFREAASFNET